MHFKWLFFKVHLVYACQLCLDHITFVCCVLRYCLWRAIDFQKKKVNYFSLFPQRENVFTSVPNKYWHMSTTHLSFLERVHKSKNRVLKKKYWSQQTRQKQLAKVCSQPRRLNSKRPSFAIFPTDACLLKLVANDVQTSKYYKKYFCIHTHFFKHCI